MKESPVLRNGANGAQGIRKQELCRQILFKDLLNPSLGM